ncbi:MAG TPA: hypothetical protein VJQ26_02435, partial [Ktedonobacteraceae bacterium]|nr:hypothetical protein [Ktedonobacteraceae bacterium]
QGQSAGDGQSITITSSHVTLGTSTGEQLYTGSLTNISGQSRWHMTASLTGTGSNSGSQLQVRMNVRVNQTGQATGTITAGSANPTGSSV